MITRCAEQFTEAPPARVKPVQQLFEAHHSSKRLGCTPRMPSSARGVTLDAATFGAAEACNLDTPEHIPCSTLGRDVPRPHEIQARREGGKPEPRRPQPVHIDNRPHAVVLRFVCVRGIGQRRVLAVAQHGEHRRHRRHGIQVHRDGDEAEAPFQIGRAGMGSLRVHGPQGQCHRRSPATSCPPPRAPAWGRQRVQRRASPAPSRPGMPPRPATLHTTATVVPAAGVPGRAMSAVG